MTEDFKPRPTEGYSALIWLGGIVLLVVAVSQCDTKSAPTNASPSTFANVATDAAIAPPPMTEQKAGDIKAGIRAYAKAAAVDDATSSMVFSKNCYAALDVRFSWAKLDQCGAFDAAASSEVLAERLSGDVTTTEYLSGENGAQRFIGAGTAHGASADAMDIRWDKTKRDAEKLVKLGRPKPKPTPTDEPADEATYSVDEDGNLTSDQGE